MRDVVVIGGGVIGLSCAYYLARDGAKVTVVEAGALDGPRASLSNAGWVVPSLSGPVPAPGVVRQGLAWLFDRSSPLRVSPRPSPAFALWLLRFASASRRAPYRRGLEATVALNRRTFELFDGLRADGLEFEMRDDGIVFAYLSPEEYERDLAGARELASLGFPMPVTAGSPQEARDLEPALSGRVHGAYLVPGERCVDPRTLMTALAGGIRGLGGTIVEGVAGEMRSDRQGPFVHAPTGPLRAGAYVVAAGAHSSRALAGLGVRLPLECGKGYCLDFAGAEAPPRRSIYLHEMRIAVTPLAAGLRVAGMMDLGDWTPGVRRDRLAVIEASARTGLAMTPGFPPTGSSFGHRPITPDGLPVIGRLSRWPSVHVATGHSMLGVTLAPATGDAIARLIAGGDGAVPPAASANAADAATVTHPVARALDPAAADPAVDLTAFAPSRWGA